MNNEKTEEKLFEIVKRLSITEKMLILSLLFVGLCSVVVGGLMILSAI